MSISYTVSDSDSVNDSSDEEELFKYLAERKLKPKSKKHSFTRKSGGNVSSQTESCISVNKPIPSTVYIEIPDNDPAVSVKHNAEWDSGAVHIQQQSDTGTVYSQQQSGTETVHSQQQCGTQIVHSEEQCGTRTVHSQQQCGTQIVHSQQQCGTRTVHSQQQCGTGIVHSQQQSGTETVCSQQQCGTQIVNSQQQSGTETVCSQQQYRTGTVHSLQQCGTQMVHSEEQSGTGTVHSKQQSGTGTVHSQQQSGTGIVYSEQHSCPPSEHIVHQDGMQTTNIGMTSHHNGCDDNQDNSGWYENTIVICDGKQTATQKESRLNSDLGEDSQRQFDEIDMLNFSPLMAASPRKGNASSTSNELDDILEMFDSPSKYNLGKVTVEPEEPKLPYDVSSEILTSPEKYGSKNRYIMLSEHDFVKLCALKSVPVPNACTEIEHASRQLFSGKEVAKQNTEFDSSLQGGENLHVSNVETLSSPIKHSLPEVSQCRSPHYGEGVSQPLETIHNFSRAEHDSAKVEIVFVRLFDDKSETDFNSDRLKDDSSNSAFNSNNRSTINTLSDQTTLSGRQTPDDLQNIMLTNSRLVSPSSSSAHLALVQESLQSASTKSSSINNTTNTTDKLQCSYSESLVVGQSVVSMTNTTGVGKQSVKVEANGCATTSVEHVRSTDNKIETITEVDNIKRETDGNSLTSFDLIKSDCEKTETELHHETSIMDRQASYRNPPQVQVRFKRINDKLTRLVNVLEHDILTDCVPPAEEKNERECPPDSITLMVSASGELIPYTEGSNVVPKTECPETGRGNMVQNNECLETDGGNVIQNNESLETVQKEDLKQDVDIKTQWKSFKPPIHKKTPSVTPEEVVSEIDSESEVEEADCVDTSETDESSDGEELAQYFATKRTNYRREKNKRPLVNKFKTIKTTVVATVTNNNRTESGKEEERGNKAVQAYFDDDSTDDTKINNSRISNPYLSKLFEKKLKEASPKPVEKPTSPKPVEKPTQNFTHIKLNTRTQTKQRRKDNKMDRHDSFIGKKRDLRKRNSNVLTSRAAQATGVGMEAQASDSSSSSIANVKNDSVVINVDSTAVGIDSHPAKVTSDSTLPTLKKRSTTRKKCKLKRMKKQEENSIIEKTVHKSRMSKHSDRINVKQKSKYQKVNTESSSVVFQSMSSEMTESGNSDTEGHSCCDLKCTAPKRRSKATRRNRLLHSKKETKSKDSHRNKEVSPESKGQSILQDHDVTRKQDNELENNTEYTGRVRANKTRRSVYRCEDNNEVVKAKIHGLNSTGQTVPEILDIKTPTSQGKHEKQHEGISYHETSDAMVAKLKAQVESKRQKIQKDALVTVVENSSSVSQSRFCTEKSQSSSMRTTIHTSVKDAFHGDKLISVSDDIKEKENTSGNGNKRTRKRKQAMSLEKDNGSQENEKISRKKTDSPKTSKISKETKNKISSASFTSKSSVKEPSGKEQKTSKQSKETKNKISSASFNSKSNVKEPKTRKISKETKNKISSAGFKSKSSGLKKVKKNVKCQRNSGALSVQNRNKKTLKPVLKNLKHSKQRHRVRKKMTRHTPGLVKALDIAWKDKLSTEAFELEISTNRKPLNVKKMLRNIFESPEAKEKRLRKRGDILEKKKLKKMRKEEAYEVSLSGKGKLTSDSDADSSCKASFPAFQFNHHSGQNTENPSAIKAGGIVNNTLQINAFDHPGVIFARSVKEGITVEKEVRNDGENVFISPVNSKASLQWKIPDTLVIKGDKAGEMNSVKHRVSFLESVTKQYHGSTTLLHSPLKDGCPGPSVNQETMKYGSPMKHARERAQLVNTSPDSLQKTIDRLNEMIEVGRENEARAVRKIQFSECESHV